MINFAGSPQGLNLGFELQGEDWEWGQSLKAERAIIEGTLENNTLTLLPFRLEQDEAFLPLSGRSVTLSNWGNSNLEISLLMDGCRKPLTYP